MARLPEAQIGKVVWSSEVYEPSDDSFALVDAVLEWLQQLQCTQQVPRICLEVGCGSGFVICSAALALGELRRRCAAAAQAAEQGRAAPPPCCRLFATDISAAALAAAAQTLAAHEVAGVELVQTDLAAALMPRLAGAVDLLLFNPPYVPTPDEEVQWEGIARAWAGGHLGRRVTDRLLAQLPRLLSPCGHAFVVTVPENRPQEIIASLEAAGFSAVVALTRSADEESLQILHVQRPPGAPPPPQQPQPCSARLQAQEGGG